MSKRAKKRQPTQTPPEWLDFFTEFDADLTRVRMLWRRGGGRYRPLVPVNLALEDLETADFEEWEDLELDETNFEWAVVDGEGPDARERRIAAQAKELWAVAVAWTRAKGPVCDFQLRGYGGADEILFEDGKRCNLSGERSRYDDEERERPTLDDTLRSLISDERVAWRQMDGVKDSLIGRLVDERHRLFDSLDRATTAAPNAIERINQTLDRAIEFQERQVQEYVSRVSGQRELEARAFREYQKTKRSKLAYDFLGDLGRSCLAALPVISDLFEEVTGVVAQTVPKFGAGQQALSYLALTLRPEQLLDCFAGDEDQKMERAKQALQLFDQLSRMRDERAMVKELEPLIPLILAKPAFLERCESLQNVAARYVLGRVALLRVVHEYEDHV